MTKSGREIVEIFEAFDLTGTAWSAAQLTRCDAKTVARYVAVRDAGGDPLAKTCRPRLISGSRPTGSISVQMATNTQTASSTNGARRELLTSLIIPGSSTLRSRPTQPT